MAKKLLNKIVLVTGASSGIGQACAIHCAKEGAALILIARRTERLEKLSRYITNEFHVKCYVITLDVSDYQAVEKNITNLPMEWKKINILINNAGLALGLDPLNNANVDDWDTMIDTNIKGMLYVTKSILPNMISYNEGHIVNIGSIAGHETYAGGVVYCATKHAITALSEGLRKDLLGTKIRVSLISPGIVETELSKIRFKGDEMRAKKVYQGLIPLNSDDVAETVIFCVTRKPHVNVNEIIILPTDQASTTMVHRESNIQ